MPQNYIVQISTDDVTFTTLTNVQEITINLGRHRQLDSYNPASASVEMRYPNGYVSPVAALVTGSFIRISNNSSPYLYFAGVINNVDVQYGIHFQSNVGNTDFVSFSCEGNYAKLGRMQGEGYTMVAAPLSTQLFECQLETSVNIGQALGAITTPMATTVVDSTWGDWIQKVLTTINGRLLDGRQVGFAVRGPFALQTSTVNFSDTLNNATNQVYDQISFGSYADNFYSQVTVEPETFASATVETGVAPFRTLKVDTFNSSTAQATDFANYLLANYGTQSFALLSISCIAEAQNNFKLDELQVGIPLQENIGMTTKVTFRGTTFNCVIEGVTFSASPSSSRFTFHLSGADLNAYLILDDPLFGKLNNNKLGY